MSDKIAQIAQSAAEKTIETLNDVSADKSVLEEKSPEVTEEFQNIKFNRDNQEQKLLTIKNQNIMARIIEKVTLNDVRECLDNLGFNSKYYREENVVVSWLSADEDFEYDVLLMFRIEGDNNDWIKMQARAKDQIIPQDNEGVELMNAYLKAKEGAVAVNKLVEFMNRM